jgi:hypothetical protein
MGSVSGFVVNPSPVARYRVAESVTCSRAAESGHLEVLKWAREHDCEWDAATCSGAAMTGELEVLQWARHRCPWDEETCELAADRGELEVLEWAIEHGCPGGERYAHRLWE